MFKGFSAWFSPELLEYKDTWTKHGGEEKDLSEADIAFASDQTSSTTEKVRPLLKILRPDWIEDSIRGQKRLSLQRYKRTFPGLDRWNSTSCEGQLVVGMEAYASTKVVSLASTSIPPYQPEVDIQDLSVSDMSAQMNNVDAFQSSGQNDSSASSTQHPVVSASVDKRQDLDQPGHHAIDLHSKEDEDNFMRPVASSELESAKVAESVGARNTTPHVVSSASAPTAVDPGDTLTPDMTTISQPAMLPRKRQLPESILRSKNDSENEGPVHLRQRQTSPKDKGNGGASMSSTKTLTLSPKPSLSAGSTQQAQEAEVNPSGLEEAQVELQPADMENDSDAQSDASIDAAEYLDTIRGQIDEDLPLLAVDITDIALTLKQFGK